MSFFVNIALEIEAMVKMVKRARVLSYCIGAQLYELEPGFNANSLFKDHGNENESMAKMACKCRAI